MSKIIPYQIRASTQLEKQYSLSSSVHCCWRVWGVFFEATVVYDQPERVNSGHMGFGL